MLRCPADPIAAHRDRGSGVPFRSRSSQAGAWALERFVYVAVLSALRSMSWTGYRRACPCQRADQGGGRWEIQAVADAMARLTSVSLSPRTGAVSGSVTSAVDHRGHSPLTRWSNAAGRDGRNLILLSHLRQLPAGA